MQALMGTDASLRQKTGLLACFPVQESKKNSTPQGNQQETEPRSLESS